MRSKGPWFTASGGFPKIRRLPMLLMLPQLAAAQAASSVALVASPDPSVFGAPVTMTASVTPAAATGRVTFYDGVLVLGVSTVSGGQAVFTTSLLNTGMRSLRAYYQGDGGDSPASSPCVPQTVRPTAAAGFQPAVVYSDGVSASSYAYGAAMGDFNGDGIPDLAVGDHSSSGGVKILLGNGDGTFRPAVSYPAGVNPFSIAVGDFNGDGKADLVVADDSTPNLSVLLGNGDGTFHAPVPYTAGANGTFLAVGDFNGDGNADLVIAGQQDKTIRILLGNGDGSFRPGATYLTTYSLSAVAIGDFNADGKTDLAIGDAGALRVGILLGNGDGTFQSVVDYALADPSWSIAAADLNGDGKTDLAIATLWGVSVLLGNGDGTFQAPTNYASQSYPASFVTIADFNGDGIPDVAVSSQFGDSSGIGMMLFLGNGDGTLQAPFSYALATLSGNLGVGDFNGDGRVDVAVIGGYGNGMSVLLGQAAANPVVKVVSVSPSSGSTDSQVFSFQFSDSAGAADLASVAVNFSSDMRTQQCQVTYDRALNTLAVWNPGAPSGGIAPGSSGTQQSVYCLLTGSGSSVTLSGNVLTLNLALRFFGLLVGNKRISGTASSAANSAAGWQQIGTWTVPTNSQMPQVVSVTPSSGTGMSQTFTFVYSEADGAAQLGSVWALIAGASQNPPACHIWVELTNLPGYVSLWSDAGVLLGNKVLGTTGTLQNNECSLNVGASSGVESGATYTLTLALSFSASFAGVKAVSGQATTVDGVISSLQQVGTWTIFVPSTIALAASPSPVVYGQPETLTATVTTGATGKVTFYDGATILGVASVSGGQATLTTRLLSSGARSLRAHYGGDPGHAPSDSAIVPLTVTSVAAAGFLAQATYSTAGPASVVAADFNGDGMTDLAILSYGLVLLGNGDGTFQPGRFSYGTLCYFGAAGDFNGDGNTDVVCANELNTVTVLLGNGDGTFQPPVAYPAGAEPLGVAVGDFDGDGNADLAVASAVDNKVYVLLGNGDGTFRPAVSYDVGRFPTCVTVGDFNGDHKTDLAVANDGGYTVSILLGNGDGTFEAAASYAAGVGPDAIAAADFNGDGRLDLAVATAETGVIVLLGNGDGTFQPQVAYPAGTAEYALAVADFNGDGRPDLAVTNGSNNLTVLLGNGDGTFQAGVGYSVGEGPASLASGDFNGDGRADLAVGYSPGNVSVLLGAAPAPGANAVSLAMGFGAGFSGMTIEVPVQMASLGILPGGFQADVGYDPQKLSFTSARAGERLTGAGKQLSSTVESNHDVLLQGGGSGLSSILNGNVAYVTFTLNPQFQSGTTPVTLSSCQSSDAQATSLPTTCTAATISGISFCDLNHDGTTNIVDVQTIVNEALGVTSPVNDMNGDGKVNAADVQIVIHAALGLGCL
jgi:hypothetical protein